MKKHTKHRFFSWFLLVALLVFVEMASFGSLSTTEKITPPKKEKVSVTGVHFSEREVPVVIVDMKELRERIERTKKQQIQGPRS